MTDTLPEPKKKSPWLQLHLSTCVVLTVVAGALVWANVTNRVESFKAEIGDGGIYGWPYYCYANWYKYEDLKTREVFPVEEGQGRPVRQVDYRALAENIGVALIILGLTALVCEFYIIINARRRDEAR